MPFIASFFYQAIFLSTIYAEKDVSVRFFFTSDITNSSVLYSDLVQTEQEIQEDDRETLDNPRLNFTVNPDGSRCITKVVLEDRFEEDELQHCDHSYRNLCHTTFITAYNPQQVQECEDNYLKNCFIYFEKVANKEPIITCNNPLRKDCQGKGEQEAADQKCGKYYETKCETKIIKQEVTDDVPFCEDENLCKDEGQTCEIKERRCTVEKASVMKTQPVTRMDSLLSTWMKFIHFSIFLELLRLSSFSR